MGVEHELSRRRLRNFTSCDRDLTFNKTNLALALHPHILDLHSQAASESAWMATTDVTEYPTRPAV